METKQEKLYKILRKKHTFSSHYVRKVGSEIYLDSADRRLREFVEKGLFRRLTKEDIRQRRYNKKGQAPLAWYTIK